MEYYGGLNRDRTKVLTYDEGGEWKSKRAVSAKLISDIEGGAILPLSDLNEKRKATPLAELKEIAGSIGFGPTKKEGEAQPKGKRTERTAKPDKPTAKPGKKSKRAAARA